MLNRHHLRIKLLQWLFASRQQGIQDAHQVFAQFKAAASVGSRSLVMAFLLLDRLMDYAALRAEALTGKHLARNRQPGRAHVLASNPLREMLASDQAYQEALKFHGIENLTITQDMLRALFERIQEGQCLGAKGKNSELQGIAGLRTVFDKCITTGEWYSPWQQEHNLHWESDRYLIDRQVLQVLQNMEQGGAFPGIKTMIQDWESEDPMIQTFLTALLGDPDSFLDVIQRHAGTWDPERLAQIDLILLQMACLELTSMPDIPVKVTLNEYIELAKVYSTPNSASFVNGLLDKIKDDLSSQGRLVKSGRGLVQNT
jgi:N utilization substance protein B